MRACALALLVRMVLGSSPSRGHRRCDEDDDDDDGNGDGLQVQFVRAVLLRRPTYSMMMMTMAVVVWCNDGRDVCVIFLRLRVVIVSVTTVGVRTGIIVWSTGGGEASKRRCTEGEVI